MSWIFWPFGLLMIIIGATLVIASFWPTRPRSDRTSRGLGGLFPSWLGGLWWLMVGGAVVFLDWSPIDLPTRFTAYVMLFVQGSWLATLVVTAIIKAIIRSRSVDNP